MKFSLPPLKNDETLANVVADLAVQIGPGVNTQKFCAEIVRNTPLPRMSNKVGGVIQGLTRKIKEEDLIVTNADKGNAVVELERSV